MRVASETPAPAARGLVFQLKAQGHHKGNDTFEKRFAIAKQLKVGRFVSKIDGDGAVFSRRSSLLAHMLPPGHQVFAVYDPTWR